MLTQKKINKYRNTKEDIVRIELGIDKETLEWFKDAYGEFWRSNMRRILRSFMVAEKTYGNDREIYR